MNRVYNESCRRREEMTRILEETQSARNYDRTSESVATFPAFDRK